MLPFLVLLVSLLGAESQAVFYELGDAEYHFEQFIVTFNKTYRSEEEKNYRFNIFKENLKKINDLNAEGHATFGITLFADLTKKEFKHMYTGLISNIGNNFCTQGVAPDKVSAPKFLDWRDKGAVTKVKNQKFCGSCWAFSVAGNLEGQYAIKHNKLFDLSEQQLLDCDVNDFACSGGSMDVTFAWLIMNGGLMKEEDYPYHAMEGKCKFDQNKTVVQVTHCHKYWSITEDQIKQLLADIGPLVIGVDAHPLIHYKKGILECSKSDHFVGHAVLIVGYGIEGKKPYWLIKNSWGTEWGEEGYFRLAMYKNSCSMTSMVMSGFVA